MFQNISQALAQTDLHIKSKLLTQRTRYAIKLLITRDILEELERGRRHISRTFLLWDLLSGQSFIFHPNDVNSLNRAPLYHLWVLTKYELLTLLLREWPRLTQMSPSRVSCDFPSSYFKTAPVLPMCCHWELLFQYQ